MAQWIWKFGEFEAYHNLRVHSRRQQYGYPEPVVWKLYPVDPIAQFRLKTRTEGGVMRITARGEISVYVIDPATGKETLHFGRREVELPAGEWQILIRVCCHETFPCLFVEGAVETGAHWEADDMAKRFEPAATDARFNRPDTPPDQFPYLYEPIAPVQCETVEGGVLFDFGKETFARTRISGLPQGERVAVRFGESRPEALSAPWCVIQFRDEAVGGALSYPPYAFRYVFVGAADAEIAAEYEYLPLPDAALPELDDELLMRICETAKYTFRLNCREFFLDGIKRDGWVWSGDAYQSLFVNRYLFHDAAIERRTLTALAGKAPLRSYINTIIDYTYIWFMSLHEYYVTYGDLDFVRRLLPRMREILAFCRERIDPDGFVRGHEGEWSFIDWAVMDKRGAFCAEQILLARALRVYATLARLLDADTLGCDEQAEALEKNILSHFYDAEKGAFIDSYESGRRFVSRQSNILAYLYLPLKRETRRGIYENVVLNADVAPITTPYFKFFEYQVYGQEGEIELLEREMRAYYGAMLATGATTLYEAFDPAQEGDAHYAMYGRPFERSLCHAWSASPVYLLARFRFGLRPLSPGFAAFEVAPVLSGRQQMRWTMPITDGTVRVEYENGTLSVTASRAGGTLKIAGQEYPLPAGETLTVNI